jgi:hypothetical protein
MSIRAPLPGSLVLVCSLLGPSGCGYALTPRSVDAAAPGDALEQAAGPRASCEPLVELLRSASAARRPYRELASLAATCSPGARELCERRLLERACELRASAVILSPDEPGGTPLGGSKLSRISVSGRAVRWSD